MPSSRFNSVTVPDVRAVLRALAHCRDAEAARAINRFLKFENGAIPTKALEAIADEANRLLAEERREYVASLPSITRTPPRPRPNLQLVPSEPFSPES